MIRVEYIIDWVKNIIIIVLITTFLGMFLPENNLRKYVRVVMGFFIISIFISPASLILNGRLELNNSILPDNKMELKWEQIKRDGEKIMENNNQLVQDYYSEKISTRVGKIVSLDFPNNKYNISSDVKNKYVIERINIDIYDSNRIETVKIETLDMDNRDSKKEITPELESKMLNLKNKICDILQISPAIVNINYYSGGELIAVN